MKTYKLLVDIVASDEATERVLDGLSDQVEVVMMDEELMKGVDYLASYQWSETEIDRFGREISND